MNEISDIFEGHPETRKVDSKDRIYVPSRIRKVIDSRIERADINPKYKRELILLPGLDESGIISYRAYTYADCDAVNRLIAEIDPNENLVNGIPYVSFLEFPVMDKARRINPPFLLEGEKEILFTPNGDYFLIQAHKTE